MIHIDDALRIMKQNQGLYFAKNIQSIYYSCSESFGLIAGIDKRSAIQGKNDMDMPWDEHIEEIHCQDQHVITSQMPWSGYEHRKTFFSSRDLYCFTSKIPMINNNQEIVGVFGTMLSVSEKIDMPLLKGLNQKQDNAEQNYHFVTPPALQQLTSQELICWFFIMRGKTSKQIGKAMGISPKTVDFHLINIKNKLNIKYKKDIIDFAFANDLIQFIPLTIRTENYAHFLNET